MSTASRRTLMVIGLALGLAAAPAPATTAGDRLVASFTAFAGSEQNAAALVDGLRTGSTITLTAPTKSGGTTSVSITPPTRPMGYGNVRIALSLAQAQLASQGITEPTPRQLQTALMGTTTSGGATNQGILQLRADGMGWGQIANGMGFKLGAVMSGHAPATAATGTASAAGHGSRSAVVTAGGGSVHGSGIATAAGGSPVTGLGHGHAAGASSAQGAAHGQGASAGGQGRGRP